MKTILKRLKVIGPVILLVIIASVLAACQTPSRISPAASNSVVSPEITVDTGAAITQEPKTEAETTSEPTPIYPSSTNSSLQLTPVENMGITGRAQDVDIAEYRLTVGGLVEKPLSLTYRDVLDYPSVTEIGIIDCPGFFVDFGEWTGVPVAALLAEAVVKPGATQLIFHALDGYKQTLSLEHVDEYGLFLAYEVNGHTLPREHGYPLRLVDSGSTGATWVKWVENIEVE